MSKTIKRGNVEMNVASLNFQVKQVGEPEDRILQFIGSDETADRDGDIISVDGWDVKNYLNNPVFLWAHDYSIPPVGKALRVYKQNGKLMFDIQFPEKGIYPFADLVYNLYKGGFLNATSVGFIGKEAEPRDDDAVKDLPEWQRGVKFLKQELLELSAVPVPSNPSALQQAKSLGAVTDDEYSSLMSFINGEFVSSPYVGAKTMKGIQNVYEAQTSKSTVKERDNVEEEVKETQEKAEKEVEQKFSFLFSPTDEKILLVETVSSKILGDVTAELKTLLQRQLKSMGKQVEKAGSVLSKKNQSKLEQARQLISDVLSQVENQDQQDQTEEDKGSAVLQDEEELVHPENTSMNPKKQVDENATQEKEESVSTSTTEKETTEEKSVDIQFEVDDTLELEVDEDLSDIIKSTIASVIK